jgi:hypothetical protein
MSDRFFKGSCLFIDSETYGDWRIDGKEYILYNHDIFHLLTATEDVSHDEIAWKGMHFPRNLNTIDCACCGGVIYEQCDISYPGIICKDAPNPYNKKYRMIDGKHRLSKMKSMNITKSPYYVIDYAIIKPLLKQLQRH